MQLPVIITYSHTPAIVWRFYFEVQELAPYSPDVTERAGFEPAVPKGHTGFRNRLDQPLRHLSKASHKTINRAYSIYNPLAFQANTILWSSLSISPQHESHAVNSWVHQSSLSNPSKKNTSVGVNFGLWPCHTICASFICPARLG